MRSPFFRPALPNEHGKLQRPEMSTTTKPMQSDPTALVAIARAAHQSGDRELERAARRELLERHGIILRFARTTKGAQQR